MKPKLSVCIVANKVNVLLEEVLNSFAHPDFELCLGFNGNKEENLASLEQKFPLLKIVRLEWTGYGPTKNELAENASCNWILSIDSDEIANLDLVENLKNLVLENEQAVYALKRQQRIGKHQIRNGSYGIPEWKTRLYNKQFSTWNDAIVHEELNLPKNGIQHKLDGTLWHLTANNLEEIREKNNHYAQLSAESMLAKGKNANAIKPLLSGTMAFIKQYIIKKGILDGKIGFQLASEIARYTSLKYSIARKLKK